MIDSLRSVMMAVYRAVEKDGSRDRGAVVIYLSSVVWLRYKS